MHIRTQSALLDIQQYTPEDVDRISSVLLDGLPLTEMEKREMGGAVQGGAMQVINGAVWGSLVAGLGLLALFNFARG